MHPEKQANLIKVNMKKVVKDLLKSSKQAQHESEH